MILALIMTLVLVAVDQVTKLLVVSYLKPIGTYQLIGGFLEFRYSENSGAAFGIFPDNPIFFAAVTVVLTLAIVLFLVKYKGHNLLSRVACLMAIAGGLGNLIDRIRLNYVIDFIHFSFFDYIFNFADCLVTVGVALLFIFVIFFMDKKEKTPK